MRFKTLCMILGGVLATCQTARAQVSFFYPGATVFTPEISIVNTGALLDSQATVSADRKYVTLSMRPQSSRLLALRSFQFQQGTSFGSVGDTPPVGANVPNGGTAARPRSADDPSTAVETSPSAILARAKSQASVLHRPGMSLVSTLND